jgi:hypothetical protein
LSQFFLEYQHLQSKEERIIYQRKNRDKIVTRGQCCYKHPKLFDGGGVDTKAVLWRQQHPDNQPCEKCPSCTLFGAMSILYKLCSHASLLQVKTPPERLEPNSSQHVEALRQLERARCFISSDLLSQFPGGYYFENSIMDNHFALSGKMAVLDKLLRAINAQLGRVLLFAHSTKTLDLIENYIMSMGGYSYLRMDGHTANAKRKEIADKFRASSQTFVFLLSTKAMGLGLNLTQVCKFSHCLVYFPIFSLPFRQFSSREANFVIMFDVDWNPSSDSQAQGMNSKNIQLHFLSSNPLINLFCFVDRAYRIGQTRDVKVFRLVARGTIEEQKYLRQVYKTQLKSETIVDVKNVDRQKSSRLFRGVAGDDNRKGELFGSENLLKFKDGTFMNYASRKLESRRYGVGVYDTNDLLDMVKDLSEDELNDIGQEGKIFGDLAKCVETNESDCDEDANLGGMSQVMMEVCEQVDCKAMEGNRPKKRVKDVQTASIPEETDSELKSQSSNETRSPLYEASFTPLSTGTKSFWKSDKFENNVKHDEGQQLALARLPSKEIVKKSLSRNTRVAGKTSNQIRHGEVGSTTFKVSDLFIPESIRK